MSEEYSPELEAAGREQAGQMPWEKNNADMFDETGALSYEGRTAQAALNQVSNTDFYEAHHYKLLRALQARRVGNNEVTRAAAAVEDDARSEAKSYDAKASEASMGRVKDYDRGFVFMDRRAKLAQQEEGKSFGKKVVALLARQSRPSEQLQISDISDGDVEFWARDMARKKRKEAYDEGQALINRSHGL